MFGMILVWLSNQVPLAGPFNYAVQRGWIPQEMADWIHATYFSPLMFASDQSDWFSGQLQRMLDMWSLGPF